MFLNFLKDTRGTVAVETAFLTGGFGLFAMLIADLANGGNGLSDALALFIGE